MSVRQPQGTPSRLRYWLFDLLRVMVTLSMVAVAAGAVWWARQQQQAHPWTRDGQVLGNVAQVAPQVAGPVIAVHVTDNQRVAKGDVLFDIDPAPFEQAVRRAEAELAKAQAEAAAPGQTETAAHAAAMDAVRAELSLARRQLGSTRVTAPVNGFVTNLELAAGTYAAAGTPQIVLIDADAFWVEGYFKETDLASIHPGDAAVVVLMSHPERPLDGRVASIAHGIERRNVGRAPGDLAQVSPTFEWIRLAQRIPVRIELIDPPADVPLRIGTTASVTVRPSAAADIAPNAADGRAGGG